MLRGIGTAEIVIILGVVALCALVAAAVVVGAVVILRRGRN